METRNGQGSAPVGLVCLMAVLFAVFNYSVYAAVYNSYIALAAGVGMLVLLLSRDLRRLKNAPALLLLGYAVFTLLSVVWAMAGKFFLLVLFWRRGGTAFHRGVMGMISGAAALCALVSIEAATTGVTRDFLVAFASVGDNGIQLTAMRLNGVFGNANVESAIYAAGILFSLPLVCGAEGKASRALGTAALSLNLLGFFLVCSLGAMACILVALVVYLVSAGNGRAAALLRLAETALPTLAALFLIVRLHSGGTDALVLPCALGSAAVSILLELFAAGRLAAALETRKKAALLVVLGAAALLVIYVAAGLSIHQPQRFGGELRRSAVLSPGVHTLQIQADGPVNVTILSKNTAEIMTGTFTTLYDGPAVDATFAVPEDSGCDLTFRGENGVTLSEVTIDGTRYFELKYPLFPDFLMNRVQPGLITQDSLILRYILWGNGLKLFRLSPIMGHGLGAFETGITRVQDFYFATRYVHNHYIQVLLEGGVIGLALFAAGLISLGVGLWKKRKPRREDARFWLYPALCAEFVMLALQMFWDVFMSYYACLVGFWLFAALVLRVCAVPEDVMASEPDTQSRRRMLPVRLAALIPPLFFMLTVGGNLIVKSRMSARFATTEEAYQALSQCVNMDLYERNDVMLTYIVTSMNDTKPGGHILQANDYADQLSRVQSNQLPYYLAGYYFNTRDYERCLDEALLSAEYSASDAKMWNQMTALLKQGFIDSGRRSPLLDEDGSALSKLLEYKARFDAYNARTLKPIALDEPGQVLFDTAAALEACNGDIAQMQQILAGE